MLDQAAGLAPAGFAIIAAAVLLAVAAATIAAMLIRRRQRRIAINVGVAYASDPDQVCKVLAHVAEECPRILREPPPVVVFEDFGANALVFSLRVDTSAAKDRHSVASDLRLRIFKAFREQGIEIAYPQVDVHLRDLDMVRQVVGRLVEERARQGDGRQPGAERATPPPKQERRSGS